MKEWRPGTDQSVRIARDQLYRDLRQFFHQRNFIEVEPPLLGRGGTTDPHIQSFPVQDQHLEQFYLQTSPEFFMKRLLADGSGPIFALTKSFRQGEQGRHHNPEFTILEWYQTGFDDRQLKQQVSELFKTVFGFTLQKKSYRQCFENAFGINPHAVSLSKLAELGRVKLNADWQDADKNTWLDALFSHCIQPQLDSGTIVFDYPASQAALAKVVDSNEGDTVARRFEVFAQGLELGNGYWELTDAEEQRRRFIADNEQRATLGVPTVKMDESLLLAMQAGLPGCAGIAFGVDRLLLLKLGLNDLDAVMDFAHKRL